MVVIRSKKLTARKRYWKAAAECVNHLHGSLEAKTTGQRWHRLSRRLLTDFQHKCMTRQATEEWNLAANWHPQDVTNVIPANAADAHDKLNSMNKDGDIEGLCTKALGMPKHSILDAPFHIT